VITTMDFGHQQDRAGHRQGQEHQSDDRETVGHLDEVDLLVAAEQDAVVRDGSDDERRRAGRQQERHEVDDALELRDLHEPLRERKRQQEREQDLHAGLRDPQLLEQLEHVPVGPRVLALSADALIPVVVRHRR
jgi:hypothetical protein